MDLEQLLDPTKRDDVVAYYKDAGLGGERYGVVCPIVDEENRQRCNKRICPQGWAFAVKLENAGKYCLHRENYSGEQPAEDITSILQHHGLPWRPLRTLTRMRENKPNKKKGKTSNGEVEKRSGNGSKAGGRVNTADVVRGSNRHGSASGEVSGGPTFGDSRNNDVAGQGTDVGSVAPSDGESGRARLFLARREREAREAE